MKNLFLALAIGLCWLVFSPESQAEMAGGTYQIDPSHSKIGFEIAHLVFSSVEGRFGDFSGSLTVGPAGLNLHVNVKVDSLHTEQAKRDKHLKSPDFFWAKKYPVMSFKSSKVSGDLEGNFVIHGTLTLHGVSRPLDLKAKFLGKGRDPFGTLRYAFKAKGELNRQDFGLKWNKLAEAGPLVGDQVELSIKLELIKP